jgi:antitoxin component of MazEF toxin-antitoxin module
MLKKQRDVFTGRYYRHGNSYVILIPPELREIMKLTPGDTIAMNFQFGVLWAVRVTPSMIVSREKVAKIFDALFKGSEEAHASE